MADASHHDSSDVVHYNLPAERTKHRAASFGFTAICIVLLAVSGGLAFKLKKQNAALAAAEAQMARVNSEVATVKSDLANANTHSSDLQAQLDKAKNDQAVLQSQMKKSEDTGAAFQADLDKARADLQAQQEKSQTELTALQAQLRAATDGSIGLRKDLAAARTQIENLNGQLATAKADIANEQKPVAAKLRELPLTTELKKAFFGGSFTLRINNPGNEPLKLDLDITGSPATPSRSATVAAGGTVEVKDLASGARVAIASEGYTPMNVTVK